MEETPPSEEMCVLTLSSVEKSEVPEGRLFKSFQTALSVTVEKYISKIKFSLFEEKYPEIYKHDSGFLRSVYLQLKSQLQARIVDDLNVLCTDQNLFQKLCQLDSLIAEAEGSESDMSWRPSNPNEDIRDHRYEVKLKQKNALEFILKAYRAQVEQLEEKAKENHCEILEIWQNVCEINKQNNNQFEILTENCPPIAELHLTAEEEKN